jgi:hydrogenase nickel incorporation protein HypB
MTTLIPIRTKVLNENQRIADELRLKFERNGVFCLNFISSPGAGKTSLLECTLAQIPPGTRVAVLTGDIQTGNDARRLARYGFPVKQIRTAGACHLDARMVESALSDWKLEDLDLLLIENAGNLVCPASHDLGESAKIVILSVTEGDDKPLKHPSIFNKFALMILNKTDLIPYVHFDLDAAMDNALQFHADMEVACVSCTAAGGIQPWLDWLRRKSDAYAARPKSIRKCCATPCHARHCMNGVRGASLP